ncbi:MAG TPA: DUF3014 domain-containing protein [Oleiagrimonas sp.]|nr:DUF3014 domain-containing protein [Oleiagrimonas sp.]
MRTRTSIVAWIVAVIVIIAIILAALYLRHDRQTQVPEAPLAASTAPAPAHTPVTHHPIAMAASAPASASTAPLPTLADSDAAVTAALARLSGDVSVGKMLANAHVIQRMVATINALPGHGMGNNILPLNPPAGGLATDTVNGQLVLSSSNYARYAPYMQWVRDADVSDVVAWYVRYYPLFQQAYRKLGYPNGYFNDRLVAVIDHLLKAPVPQGPVALVQTDKGYAFADPKLESLSVGRKLMVRMGPDNEKLVKQKLRAIRAAITGEQGPAAASSAQ